jgi:pimeloyl-ACP methyl ester carboxylesterase
MSLVAPFAIPAFEEEVAELKLRLGRLRWPSVLPGRPWQCGADVEYLRAFCAYWKDSYDWAAHRARLNEIPQFVAPVDGLRIAFWHIKAGSTTRPAVPLLLLHGWPGSQVEFERLVGPLTHTGENALANEPVFDLVVPALPGFGFAGKPSETGWHADRMADAFHALMHDVLGYRAYGVQGGDWGSLIGTRMAHRHPASIVGLHLNMPLAVPPAGTAANPAAQAELERQTGYLHLQNTKPDTVAVGLSDSPLALAAWVLEKFHAWSDCNGDLESAFSRDTLITNLMFYWLPNAAASAARLYYETARMVPPLLGIGKIAVPTGIAAFPKEPYRLPREWLEPAYQIVHWTDMPSGGHFPALERPDSLVRDIRKFFGSVSRRA